VVLIPLGLSGLTPCNLVPNTIPAHNLPNPVVCTPTSILQSNTCINKHNPLENIDVEDMEDRLTISFLGHFSTPELHFLLDMSTNIVIALYFS
jgi:hypothetical protein